MAGHVVADAAGDQHRRVGRGQPALQFRQLLARLRAGAADDRHHAGQYGDLVGRPPVFRHPPFEVGIGLSGRLHLLHDREHHVGGACRQFETGRRAAGLDDDRATLGAARHVQGPLDLEEAPLVVQRTDLVRVDIAAGLLVGDDRSVVPAIPQTRDDIDELVGAFIAQLVFEVLVAAEIQRHFRVGGRDDIPGGAPVADMVDRAEGAGDVERLRKARRNGRAEADMGRAGGERGNQRRRLEAAQE